MAKYRIGFAFRIAAWIPALAFTFLGIACGLIANKELGRAPIWAVAALLLFGLLVIALGLVFAKVAWTGRVSAPWRSTASMMFRTLSGCAQLLDRREGLRSRLERAQPNKRLKLTARVD